VLWSLKIIIIILSSILVVNMHSYGVSTQQSGKIRIVVSVDVLRILVSPIVGDKSEIVSIVPEGVEPHGFVLSPDVIRIALNSDLIVITGHMEWENDLVERVAEEKDVPKSLISINLLELVRSRGRILRLEGGENIHGFWLLPDNAVLIAESLREALSRIRPEYSVELSLNYNSFVARVSSLKDFLQGLSEKYDSGGRKVVIGFYAEQYVAEALGLEVGAVLVGEEETVKPESLSRVYNGLRSGNYTCIVVSDTALLMSGVKNALQQISADTGCSIAYVSVVSTGGLKDYDSLMYYNAGQVYSALLSAKRPVSTGIDLFLLTTVVAFLIIIVETLFLIRRARR